MNQQMVGAVAARLDQFRMARDAVAETRKQYDRARVAVTQTRARLIEVRLGSSVVGVSAPASQAHAHAHALPPPSSRRAGASFPSSSVATPLPAQPTFSFNSANQVGSSAGVATAGAAPVSTAHAHAHAAAPPSAAAAPKSVTSFLPRVWAAMQDLKQRHAQYTAAVATARRVKDELDAQLETSLDVLAQNETARLNTLKDALRRHLVVEISLLSNRQYDLNTLPKVMEEADAVPLSFSLLLVGASRLECHH